MFSTHYKKSHRPDERALRLRDLLARQTADFIERTQITSALRQSEDGSGLLRAHGGVAVQMLQSAALPTIPDKRAEMDLAAQIRLFPGLPGKPILKTERSGYITSSRSG